MGGITRETSKGQLISVRYMQGAVAAGQTDVQLNAAEVATPHTLAVDEVSMPWPGEIVGLSWQLSAAGTTGNFTIGATINGTEDADTTITVGTAQRGYLRVPREKARFVAGDRIGAEITTAAGWDGTTADLLVTVWCLVQLEGI